MEDGKEPSGLAEGPGAIAVEAFSGGDGFGGQAAVQGRFHAQHKPAAEFLAGQRLRQRRSVLAQQLNPFLDRLAQFLVHLRFVLAMHSAGEKIRAAANETLVFVAPLDTHDCGAQAMRESSGAAAPPTL